jgi:hypothetical protein
VGHATSPAPISSSVLSRDGWSPQKATSSSVSRRPRSKKGSDAVAMYQLASSRAARFHQALESATWLPAVVRGKWSGLLGQALVMVDATSKLVWVGVDQDVPDLQVMAGEAVEDLAQVVAAQQGHRGDQDHLACG